MLFAGAILAPMAAASLTSDGVLAERQVADVARQMVTTGFPAMGTLIVPRTGGIDHTVGSTLAVAGMPATGLPERMHVSDAIAVALTAEATIGFQNGWLVAGFDLRPFIVTLATMGAVRGLVCICAETPRDPVDAAFRGFLGGAFLGPVPVTVVRTVPPVWLYPKHTVPGAGGLLDRRRQGRRAPRRRQREPPPDHGVRPSGVLAAIADALFAGRLDIAKPPVGAADELDGIAAVVIGAAILGGGAGPAVGVPGGVLALVLAVVDDVLNPFNGNSLRPADLGGGDHPGRRLARRERPRSPHRSQGRESDEPDEIDRRRARLRPFRRRAGAGGRNQGRHGDPVALPRPLRRHGRRRRPRGGGLRERHRHLDERGRPMAALAAHVTDWVNQGVGGLIVSDAWIEAAPAMLDEIARADMPVVMVDGLPKGGDDTAWIGPDDRAIGEGIGDDIARRLEGGDGKIVVIRGGPADETIGSDRSDGVRAKRDAAGIA